MLQHGLKEYKGKVQGSSQKGDESHACHGRFRGGPLYL